MHHIRVFLFGGHTRIIEDDGSYVCASSCGELEQKDFMIYLFSTHQNFAIQSIIQVMTKLIITMLEQWLERLII